MKRYIFLFITLVFTACQSTENQTNEEQHQHEHEAQTLSQDQIDLAQLEVVSLQQKPVETTVSCNGVIDVPSQNRAAVVAPLGGIVAAVHVYPTEKVKKGQVLVEIRDEQYIQLQEAYLSALSKLNFLQKEYERQQKMADKNATSQKLFDETESNYQEVSTNVQSLKAQLEFCGLSPQKVEKDGIQSTLVLTSPLDGYITKVDAVKGMSVSTEDQLVRIISKEHLHLELTVFESDIPKVNYDDSITFSVQEETQTHKGHVFLIGQELNAENRSINVHGHFHGDNEIFKPGMYVKAAITTNVDTLWTFPAEAVLEKDGQYTIYIAKNENTFEAKTIALTQLTAQYAIPENPEKWKNVKVIGKGAHLMGEVEGGHDH
tara:strand:- start:333 stop:1457 length:1125 start_codon:yes stop_codon:yes gene_type:complete